MKTEQIIWVRESLLESFLSDLTSFVMACGLTGMGWWLGSTAMQWIGFVVFWMSLFALARGDTKRKSPQEAADLLYEKYRVVAKTQAHTP